MANTAFVGIAASSADYGDNGPVYDGPPTQYGKLWD
jgi:hypothetical protein